MNEIQLTDIIQLAKSPFSEQFIKYYLQHISCQEHQRLFIQDPPLYVAVTQRLNIANSRYDFVQPTKISLFPAYLVEEKAQNQLKEVRHRIAPDLEIYDQRVFKLKLISFCNVIQLGFPTYTLDWNMLTKQKSLKSKNTLPQCENLTFQEIITQSTHSRKKKPAYAENIDCLNRQGQKETQNYFNLVQDVVNELKEYTSYDSVQSQLSLLQGQISQEIIRVKNQDMCSYLLYLVSLFEVLPEIDANQMNLITYGTGWGCFAQFSEEQERYLINSLECAGEVRLKIEADLGARELQRILM